jgi:hypothetical protein
MKAKSRTIYVPNVRSENLTRSIRHLEELGFKNVEAHYTSDGFYDLVADTKKFEVIGEVKE